MDHLLTIITFAPLVGMVLILLCPRDQHNLIRWLAAAATVPQIVIAIYLYAHFDTATTAVQFAERYPWVPAYHINYFIGVDGISISMVLLTALICFISVFASFGIEKGVKGYFALLLLLDTGMMGVFVALDFFLFYIFWEVMLLPMYFLIGIWGGPRREYAAIKFFLYTLLGSVFILIALLAFYFTDVRDFVGPRTMKEAVAEAKSEGRTVSGNQVEIHTFDLVVLQRVGKAALQLLNGQPVTTSFRAEQAKAHLEELKSRKGAPEEMIRKAEADYQAALNDAGLKK